MKLMNVELRLAGDVLWDGKLPSVPSVGDDIMIANLGNYTVLKLLWVFGDDQHVCVILKPNK